MVGDLINQSMGTIDVSGSVHSRYRGYRGYRGYRSWWWSRGLYIIDIVDVVDILDVDIVDMCRAIICVCRCTNTYRINT